jgi:hypothetical protein
MAGKQRRGSAGSSSRQAGVYIEGSHVNVGGDLVGRDKIMLGEADQEFDRLFRNLATTIVGATSVSADEKHKLAATSDELQIELKKNEPDLGTLTRLKSALQGGGPAIATAVTAIFQYPPVQEAVKAMTQRLLGS